MREGEALLVVIVVVVKEGEDGRVGIKGSSRFTYDKICMKTNKSESSKVGKVMMKLVGSKRDANISP